MMCEIAVYALGFSDFLKGFCFLAVFFLIRNVRTIFCSWLWQRILKKSLMTSLNTLSLTSSETLDSQVAS